MTINKLETNYKESSKKQNKNNISLKAQELPFKADTINN
jgi:hypothetical protein